MSDEAKVQLALQSAQQLLRVARLGLDDLETGVEPDRRLAGVMSVLENGRGVEFALVRMKRAAPGFEEWFKPIQENLHEDPLLTWAKQKRDAILKRGEGTGPISSKSVSSFSLQGLMKHAPPGAAGFFLDGPLGANGWMTPLPDGSSATTYFSMPNGAGTIETKLFLEDSPTQHNGQQITDTSIDNLLRLYLDTLAEIVAEAVKRWG